MIALWIILGIVAYLIIGGIIAGFVNDDELDSGMIFTWPVVGLCVAVYCAFVGVKKLGYAIANEIKKLVNNTKK